MEDLKEENIETKSLITLKLIFMGILVLITFIFGLMPLYWSLCTKSSLILSLSNSFSGGLFLGIVLFHLLPEANEEFEKYYKTVEGKNSAINGSPFSFFICFLSYAFVLFIEKVIIKGLFIENKKEENNNEYSEEDEENMPLVNENKKNQNNANSTSDQKDKNGEIGNKLKRKKEGEKVNNSPNKEKLVTPYILLIALSIHGLSEGTALGVFTKVKQTVFLFLAISAHKWAESFSLGIHFYQSQIDKMSFIIIISIFACFAPIGIIIGIICSGMNSIIQGILLGISSGTFLYASCNEIIVEEFSKEKDSWLKYLFFLIGAGLIGILACFEVEN